MKRSQWHVIGRMQAGWHAATDRSSSSGGTLEGYLSEAADGCNVYDGAACKWADCAQMSIAGPMLDTGLTAPDKFRHVETMRRMLPGLEGGFAAVAARGLAEIEVGKREFGSLDRVDWLTYARLLRETVPGIKIGKVVNGTIVWET